MSRSSLVRYYKIRILGQTLWNLGLIGFGSALCAVSINGILIPHKFLSAGFTGVALVIHYMTPFLPVAFLYFLLNVPLFALGWRYVGRRFFLYSLAGMAIFSTALELIHIPVAVQDRMLSALLAGIITGTGSGIILRSVGSAGGVDILSVIMFKSYSIRPGTTTLAFNSLLLIAASVLFSLESALYTLVYIFVTSYFLNLVVTGLSQRKSVFIISSHWNEISREIMNQMNRGVTIIKGQGGYTGKEEQILYTVITFRELPQLRGTIKRIDPKAFMVVSETLEVMGFRIGNEPPW